MNRLKSFTSYCIAVGLSIIPALANAQTCKPLTDSKAFPPLAALVDSAALVAALPPAFAGGPSEVLVSVMMGPTPRAHTMHSTAAPATGTIIGEQILASLRPAADAVPSFRVRAVLAPSASVSVEASVLCDPKPRGSNRGLALTVAPGSGRPQGPPFTPRLKIGVNGEVMQVDLGAGTGRPDSDRSLRQALERQRYEPALLDGRPVQVWLRGTRVELVR